MVMLPEKRDRTAKLSPLRLQDVTIPSGEGVDAIPVITRSSSLKDFTVSREQARLRVTSAS